MLPALRLNRGTPDMPVHKVFCFSLTDSARGRAAKPCCMYPRPRPLPINCHRPGEAAYQWISAQDGFPKGLQPHPFPNSADAWAPVCMSSADCGNRGSSYETDYVHGGDVSQVMNIAPIISYVEWADQLPIHSPHRGYRGASRATHGPPRPGRFACLDYGGPPSCRHDPSLLCISHQHLARPRLQWLGVGPDLGVSVGIGLEEEVKGS